GERVREGLSVRAVVTSTASQRLAQDAGIALIDADSAGSTIDLDVDGADEIDPQLNLIKGAGGALLHEKLVALASRRMIVIADESKVVERLGGCAVPVEVVAFCHVMTRQRIED